MRPELNKGMVDPAVADRLQSAQKQFHAAQIAWSCYLRRPVQCKSAFEEERCWQAYLFAKRELEAARREHESPTILPISVPLSSPLRDLAQSVLPAALVPMAIDMLERYCGTSLLHGYRNRADLAAWSAGFIELVRRSVLTHCRGDLAELKRLIEVAHEDWRYLLMEPDDEERTEP